MEIGHLVNSYVILLFVLFFVKHFIIDFPLQTPYQFMNKGTYGHPGGILHSGLHVIGTLLVFSIVFGFSSFAFLFMLAIGEGIAHYHIDWAKMNLNRHLDFQCNRDSGFWTLLGLDQFLHYVTYAVMITLLV